MDLGDQRDLFVVWQAINSRPHLGLGVRGVDFDQRPLLGNRRRDQQQPAAAGLGEGLHREGGYGSGGRQRDVARASSASLDGYVLLLPQD